MAVGTVGVWEQAAELIAERKAQILDKVRKGETEVSIPIGAGSYTESEWDKLMKKIDETLEMTKEEQEERFDRKKEEIKEKKEENRQVMQDFYEKGVVETKIMAEKLKIV
ncbi:MAG: hypothetical protein K2K54_00305 [Lachnospiraceae bacterium]|nr:hypothetical protein [Lachnospiraceae bacterium]